MLILTLLRIPPLDGWRIVSEWMSLEVRAAASRLGFMPVLLLYLAFLYPTPLSDAFWTMTHALIHLFGISQTAAYMGEYMLRLG
ncbi:MAG: hypothetical protein ACR2OO_17595 [Thermomicrobiales bacterium]